MSTPSNVSIPLWSMTRSNVEYSIHSYEKRVLLPCGYLQSFLDLLWCSGGVLPFYLVIPDGDGRVSLAFPADSVVSTVFSVLASASFTSCSWYPAI